MLRGAWSGTPFDFAHTIGTGLSVIGIALLFSTVAPKVFAVVFGAGAMTLTLYSLHVVLLIPQAWSEDSMESFLKHSALILVVGTATLATFVNGGGLGLLITTGVNLNLVRVLVAGSILVALLALTIDWIGRVVEHVARPKGL